MFRVDHVAVAVRDYEGAFDFFTRILGGIPGSCAEDPGMKYQWQTLSIGDLSRLELLKATSDGSFLDGFLRNKKGGVHHITLHTDDIREAKRILDENSVPYFGYSEDFSVWKELFIHPRDAFGVLIQIAEFDPDDWIDESVKMSGSKKWRLFRSGSKHVLEFAHPGGAKAAIELDDEEMRSLAREMMEG